MLPDKTVKTLKTIYGVLCNSGSLPYQRSESENTDKGLELVPPATVKYLHIKVVHFTTICQTIFVSVRFVQSYHAKNQKFFLMFVHFAWSCAFIMICWLHLTLFISRFDVLAYWNGLFRFYGNDFSMPGARMSGLSFEHYYHCLYTYITYYITTTVEMIFFQIHISLTWYHA